MGIFSAIGAACCLYRQHESLEQSKANRDDCLTISDLPPEVIEKVGFSLSPSNLKNWSCASRYFCDVLNEEKYVKAHVVRGLPEAGRWLRTPVCQRNPEYKEYYFYSKDAHGVDTNELLAKVFFNEGAWKFTRVSVSKFHDTPHAICFSRDRWRTISIGDDYHKSRSKLDDFIPAPKLGHWFDIEGAQLGISNFGDNCLLWVQWPDHYVKSWLITAPHLQAIDWRLGFEGRILCDEGHSVLWDGRFRCLLQRSSEGELSLVHWKRSLVHGE